MLLKSMSIIFLRVLICHIVFFYNITIINSLILNNGTDAPRELKVKIVSDSEHVENVDDILLKLNISWLPPQTWIPTSYSILISSLINDAVDAKDAISAKDAMVCPEESLFYNIWDKTQYNIILPENQFMSELIIRPSCSYSIQVFANPRISANSNAAKVNIIIPSCVDQSCSCENAEELLPLVDLDVEILNSTEFLIKWNITSNDSIVSSVIIGYATPIMISKNGLPVYNTSEIARVPANTFSYEWHAELTDSTINAPNKIFVAAEDNEKCHGIATDFIIHRHFSVRDLEKMENGWVIWFMVVSSGIFVIGIFIYLWRQRFGSYKSILYHPQSMTRSIPQPLNGTHWLNSILKKHNILYTTHEVTTSTPEADKFEISYDRLNLAIELGKGQFGKVYLGYLDGPDSFPVAVKMSNSSSTINEPEARRQLLDEISTMKRAGCHPHLVKLIGCCTAQETPVCVILEYVDGGDLLAFLHQIRDRCVLDGPTSSIKSKCSTNETYTVLENVSPASGNLSIFPNESTQHKENSHFYKNGNCNGDDAKKWSYSTGGKIDNYRFTSFALDIASGLEHLEQRGIIHRDLAARNILVTTNLSLKISDFGLSRDGIYVLGKSGAGVRRLPIRWMAPEALRDRAFSSKSDVWSYAVVLWEIGTLGAFPYSEVQDDELLHYILEDNCRLSQPLNISTEFYKLMQSCWSSQSEQRPSFLGIVEKIKSLNEQHSLAVHNPAYSLLTSDGDGLLHHEEN